jgi:hypothetical protein
LEIQCTPEEKTGEEGRATNDPASGLDIPPVKGRFPSSLYVTACRCMLYTLSLSLSRNLFYVPEKKIGKDVLKLLDYTSRAARRSRRGSKRSSRKNKKMEKARNGGNEPKAKKKRWKRKYIQFYSDEEEKYKIVFFLFFFLRT